MEKMIIRSADFVKSSVGLRDCPEANFPEFAFVGRSNVGKSSLINMLVQRKQLAKSSSTPGKTQLINHFLINEERYLVDLPGYGYAKASLKSKQKRVHAMYDFLTWRETLKHVFVLIDSKIPTQPIDLDFINALDEEQIPFSVVFTKIDKTKQKALNDNLREFKLAMWQQRGEVPEIFLSSSTKQKWKDQILQHIYKVKE